jgi:hypothetical protein
MRLVDASRYFDDVVVRDAYTNVFLFKAQVAAYIDSQVDGTISRRRTISLDPSITLPTRRALKYGNEVWIVGDGIKDYLQGTALRTSVAAKRCDEKFMIRTPGDACLTLNGVEAYGQKDYLKSTVNSPTDSEYDSQYEVSFSSSETVNKGYILRSYGKYYNVRGTHELLEGFKVAEVDEIEAAEVAVTFTELGTYDPITDSYGGVPVVTTGLLMDMYKLYAYKTESDPTNKPGDKTLLVAASAVTPKVGASVSASGSWRVAQVIPHLDAYLCHLQRV